MEPERTDHATKQRAVFSLTSPHLFSIVVAIFTFPIILSSLPVADYGKWQFVLALQAWAITLSAPQITSGSKRGLSLGQDGTFFFALFKRGTFMLFPSAMFLLLGTFFLWSEKTEFGLLCFVSSFYLFINILLQESIADFLIAKKSFVAHGIWSVLTSPVARIGSSMVAFFTQSIVLFSLFQVGYAFLVSLVGLAVLIKMNGLWEQFKRKHYDVSCFRFGIRSMPIDALGALSSRLIDILIGILFGLSSLAYFSVARDLRNQIVSIFKISFPLLYADFAKQPLDQLTSLVKKRMPRMIATSTLLGGLGLLAGVGYITLFLPKEFLSVIPLFAILSLAFPVGIPTIVLSTVLQSHLRYRAIAIATSIPNLFEIMLISLLGWLNGIPGMVLAIALYGYISFLFFYLAVIKRESFKKVLEQRKLLRTLMEIY